ncbi:hypothetical protein [Telluribacter humicola]|uniref:hypothetical protein n=1 Tax=Telluribacter humicola TaxID=1720261 RepID=UPI001A968266|nr:hypothetical protein [Telluribacter humicola]
MILREKWKIPLALLFVLVIYHYIAYLLVGFLQAPATKAADAKPVQDSTHPFEARPMLIKKEGTGAFGGE